MAHEFKLPDLGEGIHEGEILAVKIQVGQHINEDDIILEVETDKAAVEIPSPYNDIVTRVNVKAGDIVHVGDTMMVFGGSLQQAPAVLSNPEDEKAATITPESVHVNPPSPQQVAWGTNKQTRSRGPVPASPSTRRRARELGVDLRMFTPTGPAGRVTAADVRQYAEGGANRQPVNAPSLLKRHVATAVVQEQAEAPFLQTHALTGTVERIPLRSVRRATAKQMALAWANIPHVTTQDTVDITDLETLRRRHKDAVKDRGGALTLTVFVIKALVNALREFPKFNASLDMEVEEVLLKRFYHVGVAVDTERGLLVPVLRDVDQKSVVDLSIELRHLVTRTRDRKATLTELQGSTITVTNIGALGGTAFTPIINYPEVAILGLAKARIQPVARTVKPHENKDATAWEKRYEFIPRLMMPIMLAFDHRVNDGAEAQRFLNRIIAQLENPEQLLLGL